MSGLLKKPEVVKKGFYLGEQILRTGASCCVKGPGREDSSKLSSTKILESGQGDQRSRNFDVLELMTASTG